MLIERIKTIPRSYQIFLGIVLFSFFLGAGFLLGPFLSYDNAQAGSGENMSGWAWSETIGWISFNNTTGGGSTSYGAHVDPTTGAMSGYAWSEYIGWIKFDPVGPYPGSPSNSATIHTATGEVSGWARACAGAVNADCSGGTHPNSGAWDGWIKLKNHSSDGGSAYGVTLTIPTGEFHGWAWGGDVVGWISFNCAEGGLSGGSGCSQSDYKIITIPNVFNPAPEARDLSDNSGSANYCGSATPPIILSWQFHDPGDTQSAYQVQVDNNLDFSSIEIDSGKVLSSSTQYAPQNLSFNVTYYWRVKVWDSYDTGSAFAIGSVFA